MERAGDWVPTSAILRRRPNVIGVRPVEGSPVGIGKTGAGRQMIFGLS